MNRPCWPLQAVGSLRDRHAVINDHATITELKQHAAAWLLHLKRNERAELEAE